MHRWGNKKDMTGDDPPYLSVGTEVSAKYKGAFCEAKIRKVVKNVKCKVQYRNEQGFAFVSDEQIKGLLMPGASVEVKVPDKKEATEGVIVKLQDLSQYTVVFDDGDIATLRRTALCLKSGRHFAESETLDQLPLTHPEHFSTPVVSGARGSRRRDDMDGSDDEEKSPKIEREEDMGKVVCVEIGDKKKSKDNWFPGLVVAPNAQDSIKIDVEEEYLVRSFKDGRYYTVPKNETTDFTRDMGAKVDNVTLKQAVEKAISFLDKNDLPAHWDREQLFRQGESSSETDASDTDLVEEDPREQKDHFVAQLYKFMDDRGTPINKGPIINSKDVDLYDLFKLVYQSGGYNRITNRNQWKNVTQGLGFTISQANNVKAAYKKFLHSFEDFYRKLGSTLMIRTDNKLRSRPNRPIIKNRDKSAPEKLLLEKDESSSSTNEDTADIKESINVKSRLPETPAAAEDSSISRSSSEGKKENIIKIKTRDPSTESITDGKLTSNTTKDTSLVQFSVKEIKEDKLLTEKRAERKSIKLIPKMEENTDRKFDKASLKITKSGKKAKPVEKRIKKPESALTQMKEKRTFKERMKAIVHKLKLKSANTSDQKKKKQKPVEELNKFLPQGLRIKLKDEFATGGIKSRKLSASSSDSKSTTSGHSSDKKTSGSVTAGNNNSEPNSVNCMFATKIKKSDEEGGENRENLKRKSSSRKRKDDDKLTNNSSESQMYEAIEFLPHYKSICIGDRLRVYYEPTHESKITYEAKVTNKRQGAGAVTEYLVHYTGWNTRYDEWIRRSRISDNLSWTPARAKRKSNQLDVSPGDQIPIPEKVETQVASTQNPVKTEKSKRASQSPVAKNRSKMSIKSGVKQMKTMKAKLESKSKKMSSQKESDNGSESEDENSQRQNKLQKTRSRTEKQKQQDEEATNAKDSTKDTGLKKKGKPTLKRTRSGSIKLEGKSSPKKSKMTPLTEAKTNKPSAIRNSIMKSLVPRKRVSARTKESKDEKYASETSNIADDVFESKTDEDQDTFFEDIKPLVNESEKKAADESSTEDKTFVLKITPVNADKMKSFVREPSTSETKTTSEEVGPSTLISAINEESTSSSPEKETSNDTETVTSRVNNAQYFTDSYLAENLEVKPKVAKAKIKKDSDEKSVSPTKLTNRSPSESNTKSVSEVKEKTIFTSRSPSEKRSDKTPEKDGKLRNFNTFTSYLSMDKIDLIKKVGSTPEKSDKPEKSPVASKTVDLTSVKSLDDIYEFNEPEPVAIDDRTILHRRATPRIYEENNAKRTKFAGSTVDPMQEVDESSKSSEDENIVETKEIPVRENPADVEKEKKIENRLTSEKEDAEELTSDDEDLDEEVSNADITMESVKSIILRSSESPTSVGSKGERSEESNVDKSDDEDEGDDAEESKLIISEVDSALELGDVVKGSETSATDSKVEKVEVESVVSMKDGEVEVEGEDKTESSDDEIHDKVTKTKRAKMEQEQKPTIKKSSHQSHSESRIDKESNVGNQSNFSSHDDITEEEAIGSEIEGSVTIRKDKSGVDKKPEETLEDTETDDHSKTKYEDESDGLLLCEETIPKSPETKDVSDMDVDYSCALPDIKKAVDLQLARVKKESRSSSFASPNDTPPTTPEDTNSTPGTSPSEGVSGFSSTTFSLNEKSGSNKDSSENETSSDTSEKLAKVKKYSNEVYAKKNAFEFDTYLKSQAEQRNQKSEETTKKKTKSLPDTSVNGTDKDDSSDVGSSTQAEEDSPKAKPSIAYILAQIPGGFDSNQRIEFLEQKQEEIRRKYMHYKQEVSIIDRKRKKLRRKQREGRMMTRNEANSLLS